MNKKILSLLKKLDKRIAKRIAKAKKYKLTKTTLALKKFQVDLKKEIKQL